MMTTITPRLKTFRLRYHRSESAAIFGPDDTEETRASRTWRSDVREEDVMRAVETARFRVEYVARTQPYLDVSWLHTVAHVTDTGDLVITESSRYSNETVQAYGAARVADMINEDHREMRDIVRAYVGMRRSPRVFRASVRVIHKKSGAVLGESSPLDGCIYDTYEEYVHGWNASDQLTQAIERTRDTLSDLCL